MAWGWWSRMFAIQTLQRNAFFQVVPVLQLLHSDAVTVPFSGRMWVLIWGLGLNLALTKLATIFDFRPIFQVPVFSLLETWGDVCWWSSKRAGLGLHPPDFFMAMLIVMACCRAKVDETQDHCGKRNGKLWWKLCRKIRGIHRMHPILSPLPSGYD